VIKIYDNLSISIYVIQFQVCFEYMDVHASEVVQHESFLHLSSAALTELISRDSFCAPEIEIFSAIRSWVNNNPDVDSTEVLGNFHIIR